MTSEYQVERKQQAIFAIVQIVIEQITLARQIVLQRAGGADFAGACVKSFLQSRIQPTDLLFVDGVRKIIIAR